MAYNLGNSLSPMIFKKHKVKTEGGTRSERYRSKSMENITDPECANRWVKGRGSKESQGPKQKESQESKEPVKWKELTRLKTRTLDVVVMCLVPSAAMDFVASALLAVGSSALITEGVCTSVTVSK